MSLSEHITVEDLLREKEGQLFDRKSGRIDPRDLVNHFIAFANADGGIIAMGIEQDGTVTGLRAYESEDQYLSSGRVGFLRPPDSR